MKKLSFLTTCLFIVFVSQAQEDSTLKNNQQFSFTSARVTDNKIIKERSYAIYDNQLVPVSSFNEQHAVALENIKPVRTKKNTNVIVGAIVGFVVGAYGGMSFGKALANSADEPVAKPMIAFGLSGGATCAYLGGLTGALLTKKVTIGGKKAKTRKLQSVR